MIKHIEYQNLFPGNIYIKLRFGPIIKNIGPQLIALPPNLKNCNKMLIFIPSRILKVTSRLHRIYFAWSHSSGQTFCITVWHFVFKNGMDVWPKHVKCFLVVIWKNEINTVSDLPKQIMTMHGITLSVRSDYRLHWLISLKISLN